MGRHRRLASRAARYSDTERKYPAVAGKGARQVKMTRPLARNTACTETLRIPGWRLVRGGWLLRDRLPTSVERDQLTCRQPFPRTSSWMRTGQRLFEVQFFFAFRCNQ